MDRTRSRRAAVGPSELEEEQQEQQEQEEQEESTEEEESSEDETPAVPPRGGTVGGGAPSTAVREKVPLALEQPRTEDEDEGEDEDGKAPRTPETSNGATARARRPGRRPKTMAFRPGLGQVQMITSLTLPCGCDALPVDPVYTAAVFACGFVFANSFLAGCRLLRHGTGPRRSRRNKCRNKCRASC